MPTVKICPKCASENVKIDYTNAKSAIGFSQTAYLCLDCGHSGTLFPEIKKTAPETPAQDALGGITWLGHASFMFHDKKNGNRVYYAYPHELKKAGLEKADIIFITHAHHDHCEAESVRKILKPGTIIAAPSGCKEALGLTADFLDVAPNKAYDIKGFKFKTVPAYNVRPERLEYHPQRNNWVGYIFQLNGKTIYHTGDTDLIPEMRRLGNIDIAFIPMGGTYGMDVDEAIDAANLIKAGITVPMHYRRLLGAASKDAEARFKSEVVNSTVVIMDEVS